VHQHDRAARSLALHPQIKRALRRVPGHRNAPLCAQLMTLAARTLFTIDFERQARRCRGP